MAFANIAGRAGFVIDLDKSAIDRGLPQVEQQFTRSMGRVEATTRQSSLNASRNLDPLLAKVREMRVRADELSGRARALGTGLDTAAEGARTLDSGMGSLVARAGLATVGLTTAYHASRALSEGLKTTGEEAFTVEGRLKNLGSALLRGDIVGGIQSLGALPKNLEEWGVSLTQATTHYEAFKALARTDSPFAKLAQQAVDLADTTRLATAAQDALNFSLRESNVVAGQLVRRAPRPEEGAAARDVAIAEAEGPTSYRLARPIGPTARNAAAQTLAQARGDLPELLRLQEEEAARLEKAFANSTGNRQQRIALNQQLASAQAAVIGTQKQIKANADAEARAAQTARDAAKRAREAAAAEAARELRERQSTREQRLRNRYDEALLTPGTRDDRRAFGALSRLLIERTKDQRLDPGERADAKSRLNTLRKQRVKDAIEETNDELKAQELVLQNNVKAAELTEKNIKDDLRARRRLRDFYKRAQREADTVLERQQFRAKRIAEQKEINDLLRGKDPKTGGTSDSVFADFMRFQHEFLTGMISQFIGGTGTGNSLQTHALEQFTLQGNQERAEQTRHLRTIANRGGRRELDEALMS